MILVQLLESISLQIGQVFPQPLYHRPFFEKNVPPTVFRILAPYERGAPVGLFWGGKRFFVGEVPL